MILEIKIPAAGESVTEAAIGNWLAEDGSFVEKDQEIAEVETDKATLPLIAPTSGLLKIVAETGKKVKVGDLACTIDTEGKGKSTTKAASAEEHKTITTTPSAAAATSEEHMTHEPTEPIPSGDSESKAHSTPPTVTKENPSTQKNQDQDADKSATLSGLDQPLKVTPLAQRIMEENDLDLEDVINGLKKITRHEVEQVLQQKNTQNMQAGGSEKTAAAQTPERTPMSPLRRKLSKRLVAVKNETAMLTTFNEVDMSSLMNLRKKHQDTFKEKFGQKPGLVSFFAMACSKALQEFPRVNSYIDGDDIVTPHQVDIAIAVQTDKGLMVPVIRNTASMNISQLELAITEMANKARAAKLSIDEMTGGTFTITNGGVFGSMLSTPILNPPQSAILGMHNIVDRPVAINGKVEIRPIMYVALSYDHRLIDGRDSVSFLVKVKQLIESPVTMLLQGRDPEKMLLGL
ncbi:MAG TPA: 2-oxoglutarate dehydrogenase complex dihydrolipoyllysine-residue succinyltransferase [Bacteroidales bacterium]|nr:2-oxoglutarate dehydrogenase complex dihydrolipoyllysine-residue succinyltransferase [Bacteroidales bacterium]